MNFLELVRMRRSVRRFVDRPVEPEKIDELRELAARAMSAFDAAGAEVLIVHEPAKADELRRAIVSGWQGKINPWIYVTPIPAWVVLLARTEPDGGDNAHTRHLPGASMMMETIVLAVTEMGQKFLSCGGTSNEVRPADRCAFACEKSRGLCR